MIEQSDYLLGVFVVCLWVATPFVAAQFVKIMKGGDEHFIIFFLKMLFCFLFIVVSSAVSVVTVSDAFIDKDRLAFLAICIFVALGGAFILIHFSKRARNLVGDCLDEQRCYNCGNTHFFRKGSEITLENGSIGVCSDCFKNAEKLEPVVIYTRVLRHVGHARAREIEDGVIAYKVERTVAT